ncbi:RNA polymerase archaeal subunit P/eukaryotic subunit RPABC4 protein [Dioscorea alata]|uniref:RNA polymerase archaeal subunit P/eukaryotic subunit RPABC4 protein n=1 Tax=Dioscorea alata TaxID=55571 RepID=A0ACB7TT80_DIOAL|nr:RNA polymerase archaeal subunit P/eukaryotic subunit RPABC4 protein [Dioscorea alata]
MADNSEKRFQKVMDKLYFAPSPKPRPPLPRGKRALELGKQERLRLRRDSIGSLGLVPQCRPWDRGDLMRRLATYKAMTWFGKPKVVNPVNCARRGWINVEMDTIACEACGARLLFSTPSSWSLQQVEKAAAVFSLKLDNGHKLLCPWIDNVCDEALALLPPTPPATLIEGYKERASMLIRLSALPAISSSTIGYMKSPQLTHLLSQSSLQSISLASGIKLSNLSGDKDLDGVSESAFSDLYYQSLKIISLCGWEPRLLPYSVDPEDQSSPANEAHSSGSSVQIPTDEKIIIYPAGHSDDVKVDKHIPHTLDEYQYDPTSVVLDCRLCGACVGLWAFATTPRPLELFSIIASPDSNGQDELLTSKDLHSVAGVLRTEKMKTSNTTSNNGTSGTDYNGATAGEKPLRLNLTIAGGPPPTKQNFKPRVSFPIISRHLRAQLGPDLGFRNYHSSGSSCMNRTEKESLLVTHADDLPQNKKGTNDVPVISEHSGSLKRKRVDDVTIPEHSQEHFVNSEYQLEIMPNGINDPGTADNNPGCAGEEAPHAVGTVGDDMKVEGSSSASNATAISTHADVIEKDTDSSTTKLVLQKATESNHHEVSDARDAHSKFREFDPIRQHRPFCPWIAPIDGKSTSGWKLTLSALVQQEKSSSLPSSQSEAPPALLDEVDDPVDSIRKLFMSPAAKKIKSSH